jgi:RimJ/RimL family protein N-acetyltransferase
MKSITTPRLQLRLLNEHDFAAFAEYYSDEDDARFVGGKKNADAAWRHLALHIGHYHLRGFGHWAVDEKESGEFAGCAGLWQSHGWPELELGYWVVKKHRRKGYAYEAALHCREYARTTLRAHSLVSYIDPDNTQSIQLAAKLGAEYEKTIHLPGHGPHCVYRHF